MVLYICLCYNYNCHYYYYNYHDKQEAQLPQRDHATRYSSKFMLRFMKYELERLQTANVTFKIIQEHWQWCNSIGHMRFPINLPLQLCLYLAQFPRYYQLFPEIERGHVTLNTSLLEVIYHACSSTSVYQSAHEIISA